MPINNNRTNNKILPANVRAVDVAKATINALIPIQRTRYAASFEVQGYDAVIYHRLSCGLRCGCKSKSRAINARLDKDGHAHEGFLNEMLTGGSEFGVREYAMSKSDQAGHDPRRSFEVDAQTLFSINEDELDPDLSPSLFDRDDQFRNTSTAFGVVGDSRDAYGSDPQKNNASTIVPDGFGPNGPVEDLEFEDLSSQMSLDRGEHGATDYACPICFGSGYVGGFSVFNGWRGVFNYQHPSLEINDGIIYLEEDVPHIQCTKVGFETLLPYHCESVDALRVFDNTTVIPADVFIDNIKITNQQMILPFFDGRYHKIEVAPLNGRFTHLEIQINQSDKSACLEFPKMTRSAVQSVIQNLNDFSLVVSPIVPVLRPMDFIVESTFGAVLQVKTCNHWNDKSHSVLGWEADVRPIQPEELCNRLPRRRRDDFSTPRSPSLIRDNVSGPRRT